MKDKNITDLIKAAIISGFTIAVAFIWKDVILEAIETYFPANTLLYKLLVAVLATVVLAIIVYIFLKAEGQASRFFKRKR